MHKSTRPQPLGCAIRHRLTNAPAKPHDLGRDIRPSAPGQIYPVTNGYMTGKPDNLHGKTGYGCDPSLQPTDRPDSIKATCAAYCRSR
jgi:hypothetical protein